MSVVATNLICIFLYRHHGSLMRHCGAFFSHLLQKQRFLNHPVASEGRARPVCFLVQPWHCGYWHCRQYFNRSLRTLANASRDCNFLQRAHQIGLCALHRFCSQYHALAGTNPTNQSSYKNFQKQKKRVLRETCIELTQNLQKPNKD